MDWITTSGTTLDEAKSNALDQLGIVADEAEFDVVNDVQKGLFGRVKVEAKVRHVFDRASLPRKMNDAPEMGEIATVTATAIAAARAKAATTTVATIETRVSHRTTTVARSRSRMRTTVRKPAMETAQSRRIKTRTSKATSKAVVVMTAMDKRAQATQQRQLLWAARRFRGRRKQWKQQ